MYATDSILTILFCTLFIFSYTLPLVQPHHVVFEEIVKMAGTLLYIHALLPINILGFGQAIQQFQSNICQLQEGYQQQQQKAIKWEKYQGQHLKPDQQPPGSHA